MTLGELPIHFDRTLELLRVYPQEIREVEQRPSLVVSKLVRTGHFWFVYDDAVEFIVDEQGSHVWAKWPNGLTIDDVSIYLLGPILGFVLRLRGTLSLHASVVELDRKAIAILGPAGAGKSTLAAAFAMAGHRVLSDDITPVLFDERGRFMAQPGYPRLRLWPDAVRSSMDLQRRSPASFLPGTNAMLI